MGDKNYRCKWYFAIISFNSCNQTIEDTYYIPVLNWGMCKKCFDEWKETAIFYKEDTDFEELNIHWIEKWCDRLNISMTNTTFH